MIVLIGEYKEVLEIEGNTEDEFVEQIALEVEDKVKNYLNRDVEDSDYVELYDGSGTEEQVLEQFPINSVSKIEIYDGIDVLNAQVWTELVQGDDYERIVIPTHKDSIILGGSYFPAGQQNVRITYNAGWEEPPNEIRNACKKLALLSYGQLKKTKSVGISSISTSNVASGSVSYDKEEESRILKDLEKFRRIPL
jgi:hypothetical protein